MQIVSVIATIAALAIIIVVHEFGHFAVSKAFRIPVEEFSLGFGAPVLASFRRGETRYVVRPFLLGGFVRITGMEPDSTAENGFDKRPLGQRMAVVIAGSAMNLITAIIVFILLGLIVGKIVGTTSTIEHVLPRAPAERAGLRPGDQILAVDGVSGNWDKIREQIRSHPRQRVLLTLERGGRRVEIPIRPESATETENIGTDNRPRLREITVGQIGIVPRTITRPMGLGESLVEGMKQAQAVVELVVKSIAWAITGAVPAGKVFGGPVRLVHDIAQGYELGWKWFVGIIAIFSFQIGLINLFPIPALDGSRAAFLIVEGIRRRPLDKRKEAMVHVVGFALLLAAILLLTFNDLRPYVAKWHHAILPHAPKQ